MERVTAHS